MKTLLIDTLLVALSLLIAGCGATLKDVNRWQMRGSEGIPLLIEVAEDDKADVDVRLAAAKALDEMGLREATVNALIAIGEPATEALVKITEDDRTDPRLRLAAENALNNMRVGRLITQLTDPDANVRNAASTQLSEMGEKLSQSQIDQLVSIMRNGRQRWSRRLRRESHCTWYEDTTVKYYAAGALMEMQSPHVTSKLVTEARSARNRGRSTRRVVDPGWI